MWLLNKPHRVISVFAEAIWELGSPMSALEFRFLFLPGAAVHMVWMFGFARRKSRVFPWKSLD